MPGNPAPTPRDDVTPWYVADRGQLLGPLLDPTVVEWLRSGRFAETALVWRLGLDDWEPISRHFPPSLLPVDDSAGTSSLAGPLSRGTSLPSPLSRWLPLLAAGYTGVLFYSYKTEVSDSLTPPWIAVAWAGAILATLGLGTLAIVKWWQYAARISQTSRVPHLWGVLKVTCVLLGICLIGGEAIAGLVATRVYRLSLVTQVFADYTMTVGAGDTLLIDGSIGPGFARRVNQILGRQPEIQRIEIRSPGGIVQEGLRAAEVIEQHSGLAVIARQECVSTCIIVLLAGKKKYADWDMKLGFHAIAEILPGSQSGPDSRLAAAVKVVDGFLTNHGVPGWIIANMERAGPQHYVPIPAIELVKLGVLTGVLDGDEPLTLRQAKWLWVERVVAQRAAAPKQISALYGAIDTEAGFVADRYVDDLYDTAQQKYFYRFNTIGAMMMDELVASAVGSADDKALTSYIAGIHGQLDRLAAASDWRTCRNLLDAAILVGANRVAGNLLTDYGAGLASLLRSANESGWKAPAPRDGAELAGRELLTEARMLLAAEGVLLPDGDRSAQGRCLLARETYGLLAAAPVEDARTALGWLGRYDRL
jgi:hypothetical protein